MKKVWKLSNPIHFYEMGSGLMLVESQNIHDKNKVSREGPWSFDKCLIVMKEFEGVQQVKNIHMETMAFWVRVHDLPLMVLNEQVGRRVGEALTVQRMLMWRSWN